MALGIQNGSVTSRGFVSGGLGNALFNWFTLIPALHGPGWYVVDDQRALGTDPYFVVSDQSSPTANSKAIFLRITQNSSNERIEIRPYLWWNSSTHVGFVNFSERALTTITGSFAYYFRGGTNIILLATRIGTSISYYRLSRFQGIWNATTGKGLEPETAQGTLTQPAFQETGDNNNQLSGYHNLTGYAPLLDAASKLYFSVSVSGANIGLNIYRDSARTLRVGFITPANYSVPQAVTVQPDNSSGLGGTIFFDAKIANDTDIEVTFLRLVLGTGEGANFTVGRRYFLCDFTGTSARIDYVTVTAISGNTLSISGIGAYNFQTGAYLSPYPHRWISSGDTAWSGSLGPAASAPYRNVLGSAFSNTPTANYSITGSSHTDILQNINPDDATDYPVERPWLRINTMILGYEIEAIIGAGAGLSAFQDRRIVNSVPWLCYNAGSPALLVLDQEST